jgi:hypothetical protein
MPLGWNEIHARAARFAEEWKDAHYEKGETQTFYNEFFEVFGRRRRDVSIYEQSVKKLNNKQGFIDLFWPSTLLVEQKSAGRNLQNARTQAIDYCHALKEQEKPRYILLSDFQTFEMLDLDTNTEHHFTLAELPDKIKDFGFIAGYHQQEYKDQDPVNLDAAALMRGLHMKLEDSGYEGTDLERLLVRIMFCLFADDTAIFQPDSLLRYIEDRTSEDGTDLGSKLVHLFEVLDTPIEKRQKTLDEALTSFPYVNGNLFTDNIRTPSFDTDMRQALLDCCYFNWSKVSPALFGSLFQTVMQADVQRKGGAHYTSEKNILKTIQPLFMDELREEFIRLKDDRSTQRMAKLNRFHERLGTLTFFDPACGCGNFLILAYRELRELEIDVLKEIHAKMLHRFKGGAAELNVRVLCKIDVDQFYGIEIEEFPARIAEAAMWLVDHQMNVKLGEVFGQAFERLPLKKSAHITYGNALEVDWKSVIAPEKLSYMLGNPPFIGSKYQSLEQRKELKGLFAKTKGAGVLDYVSAWYWLAAQYIQNTKTKVAFVSTNSITQGEQVGVLWQPLLNQYGIKIHFAHRTFKWTIDEKRAKGMKIANVHTVIIGFAAYDTERKHLYDYETITSEPTRIMAANINPYLVDAVNVSITGRSNALCDVPEMGIGNKPIDGGYYLFTEEEKDNFLKQEPNAEPFFKRWIGSHEFLNGYTRWCLWLGDCPPQTLRQLPLSMKRIESVRRFRLGEIPNKKGQPWKKPPHISTQNIAATPTRFHVENMPLGDYLVFPKTSSEKRNYLPIGYLSNDVLCGDAVFLAPRATLYHFGVLTSQMHMDWMRYTAGRLKSDYRYSNTLVYNNFPWPQNVPDKQRQDIEAKAQAVLDARANYEGSTLADLYNPLTMPPDLLKAHHALDKAVDKAYRTKPFANERERIEYLFEQYQKLTAPLDAQPKKKTRKKKAS